MARAAARAQISGTPRRGDREGHGGRHEQSAPRISPRSGQREAIGIDCHGQKDGGTKRQERSLAVPGQTATGRSRSNEDAAEEKARSQFKRWDTDGSGYLDEREMRQVLIKMGLKGSDIMAIFKTIDADSNGRISYEEFIDWTRSDQEDGYRAVVSGRYQHEQKQAAVQADKDEDREHVLRTFKRWDADGSGKLDRREFQKALSAASLRPAAIDQMWTLADKDHNGLVDISEFVAWAFTLPRDQALQLGTKNVRSWYH
eukprot:TRINITY_DN75549_c0_g1_i1.p1 TRINITY_DN75549_c0_g1~~TRINITY_DN75549_c0_g1_i1.p1  ORF type:complete len:270 (-),score=43.56 TRINITY_DN75549_c0_g1_i1:94-867(-)